MRTTLMLDDESGGTPVEIPGPLSMGPPLVDLTKARALAGVNPLMSVE